MVGAAATGGALVGCARSGRGATAPAPYGAAIVIDGELTDWRGGGAARADGAYVYLRVPGRRGQPLQAADYTTHIGIDVDANAETGVPMQGIGAEFVALMSPRSDSSAESSGGLGRGIRIEVANGTGEAQSAALAEADVLWLPTCGAEEYELRLSRVQDCLAAVGDEVIRHSGGPVTAMIEQRDAQGSTIWRSAPVAIDLPRWAPAERRDVDIPLRPAGSVRIVSSNVLWASPMKEPAPFARALGALQPDIVLFQEWDNRRRDEPRIDASQIVEWLNHYAGGRQGGGRGWSVTAGAGGVLVASRYPMSAWPAPERASTLPARFAGAFIETPVGTIAAASLHLKCCGSAESSEDIERRMEAQAIAGALDEIAMERPEAAIVLGGDVNLVGSHAPLDLLCAAGRGGGGAGLRPAAGLALGDSAIYTWRDPDAGFAPGRLDYVLVDSGRLRVAQCFVLDTALLSDEALQRAGLERTDSAASDHLPLVVDVTRAAQDAAPAPTP